MDISHLYNDSFLGSPTTALDVKEKLQTQEINAREDRTFEQWVKIFQMGKDMCKKNLAREKWQTHRSLYTIWERTPRLEKSLEAEKARVASLEKSILARSNSEKQKRISSRNLVSDKLATRPQVVASGTTCPKGDVPSVGVEHKHMVKLKVRERPLNTDFRLKSYLHRQADFVRRSQHVVRSLARLNWRQQKRRRDHEKFREELFRLSKPVIVRARVVLKGHPELDANQYLNALENYLLQSESSTSPRNKSNTVSEDEVEEETDADSVLARSIGTNSCRGSHYAVLPPVLTASNGGVAEDTTETTKDSDFSSSNDRSTKHIDHKNTLKVGSSTEEDSTAISFSESRTRPRNRIQHIKATTNILQKVENTQRASRNIGRRFLLTSLKASNFKQETVTSKQGIHTSAVLTNNSKEASSSSKEKSNSKSRNNVKKSSIVNDKTKTVDKDVSIPERGIDNTSYVIRTRSDATKARNQPNRSNNCGIENHNDSGDRVKCDLSLLNKRRYDASNRSYSTGHIVEQRSNACNYANQISDKRSDTSKDGNIVVSDKRSDTSNCGHIAISDKRSDISNSDTIATNEQRSDTCNSSITQIKNKRSDIFNPSTSWVSDKGGDNTNDILRIINTSRNDTYQNYDNTNKRETPNDVVTNDQRDTTSDSRTSTGFTSNSEELNHTQGCVPCVNIIGIDTFGRIDNTGENNETKDNTTQTRNRRVRDVYNNSNLDRIQKVKTTKRSKDSNTSINNSAINSTVSNNKSNDVSSNNIDSIAVSQAGSNNTDNSENTNSANDNRRSYSILGDKNTQRLLHSNISSNNNDSKSTDNTLKESEIDEPVNSNTNNIYNNTYKHIDTNADTTYNNTHNTITASSTKGDTNSMDIKSPLRYNGVRTHNTPRKNDTHIEPVKNTTKHGGMGAFIYNKQNDNTKKPTFYKDDETESDSMGYTDAVPSQQRIKYANKATTRDSSMLAARKSSHIFAPSGGVSQVIPEEDEYMYTH